MNEQIYAAAYDAFRPEADDNPDAVPYYRAAVGLRAAWGREFCDEYSAAFHACFCAAGAVPVEDGLRAARAALLDLVERQKHPDRPFLRAYVYQAWPAEPTEADARALFREEYKRAFPGRRAGSKHYNDLWKEKAERAREILRGQHETAMERFRAEEATVERANERREAEWRARCDKVDAFVAAARKVLEDEK